MTLVYVLAMISLERLHSADARESWDMWNRVFAAYRRRLYGEALDLMTDRREWI